MIFAAQKKQVYPSCPRSPKAWWVSESSLSLDLPAVATPLSSGNKKARCRVVVWPTNGRLRLKSYAWLCNILIYLELPHVSNLSALSWGFPSIESIQSVPPGLQNTSLFTVKTLDQSVSKLFGWWTPHHFLLKPLFSRINKAKLGQVCRSRLCLCSHPRPVRSCRAKLHWSYLASEYLMVSSYIATKIDRKLKTWKLWKNKLCIHNVLGNLEMHP